MNLNDITYDIRGAAFRVHRALGPGLLESAYEGCLMYELVQMGYEVQQQVSLPLYYGDVKIEVGYRIDLLVAQRIVLELKSVDTLLPIHTAQLLTYLKLSNLSLGLLMNFNIKNMQKGIIRYVL